MHGGIAVAGDGVEAFAQEGFVAAGREAQGGVLRAKRRAR